jgi:capsular polysaccharide transport system ATP-binding protein
VIHLDDVTKEYRLKGGQVKTIVRNLTMDLPRRNIALLGRNGMGKSTLMRLISRVEDPDRGRVTTQGQVSWPIGFRGSFHRDLTGLENVKFVARIYGQDTERVIEYVKDFAEIGPFFFEPYKTYSSGMGARLAFGLSMAINFDVYLIDEIMSVGDASFQHKSKETFHGKLANSHIIMASHSMDALRDYCDCGVVMHDGTMTYFDDLEDAIQIYEALNAAH